MSRKLILLFGDIGLMVLAAIIAANLILDKDLLKVNINLYSGMVPIMLILMGILFNVNGLFSLERKRYAEILLSLAVSFLNLMIIMMAISFFVREFSYSRGVLLLSVFLQFIMIALWKYIFWRIECSLHSTVSKALLIGNNEECERVFTRLRMQPQMNLEIKYICTDRQRCNWKNVIDEIDLVVVCSDLKLKEKSDIVHTCNMKQKQVLLIPDIYELFCSGAELQKIDDIPVFKPQPLVPSLEQRSLKRMLDILISWSVGVLASPFFLITAIAIKIFDPGPIFYSQVRTGRNEKKFKVYKFRTMRVDAEKFSGPMMSTENDPRITKLGRFMRATRLDELPQLWNVIVGDMSIVGPRPERPFFVEQFKKEIPEYIYRHNVKPGITGLAQVYGKYNTTPYDKLIYDLMYIQKCNMLNDLVIIIQTVRVLATKSATEGVGSNQKNVNLDIYKISDIGTFKRGIYK
ncbi:sugar transferase [Propionispira raffinosivorans]|uniref:sugar transferase n=1 Tax=Propionispira raffinosivorans TaxID=86959 RepID=UPI00036D3D10|nr:sugar transferase [Propionispira raffinosivorans]